MKTFAEETRDIQTELAIRNLPKKTLSYEACKANLMYWENIANKHRIEHLKILDNYEKALKDYEKASSKAFPF